MTQSQEYCGFFERYLKKFNLCIYLEAQVVAVCCSSCKILYHLSGDRIEKDARSDRGWVKSRHKILDDFPNFSDGVDSFGLSGSLDFSDLSITDNTPGTATLIEDATNNQLLAIVNNVSATDITVDDFMTI